MGTVENADRELIEGTIADLEYAVTVDEKRLTALTTELQNKKDRLNAWRQKLIRLNASTSKSTSDSGHKRRPKGQNLRSVRELFTTSHSGMSIKDVADKLSIPWSSARKALTKNPDLFTEKEGLWYSKESQNGTGGRSESLI